jgi:hypothetical protein
MLLMHSLVPPTFFLLGQTRPEGCWPEVRHRSERGEGQPDKDSRKRRQTAKAVHCKRSVVAGGPGRRLFPLTSTSFLTAHSASRVPLRVT